MSGQWHGGKGSSSRPMSVTHEEYTNRWDHIFGRDLKPKSDDRLMEMPGTLGSAKVVMKDENESSGSNSDNRK